MRRGVPAALCRICYHCIINNILNIITTIIIILLLLLLLLQMIIIIIYWHEARPRPRSGRICIYISVCVYKYIYIYIYILMIIIIIIIMSISITTMLTARPCSGRRPPCCAWPSWRRSSPRTPQEGTGVQDLYRHVL